MRETARASILSLKAGGRGNDYGSRDPSDESHSNLHNNGPKASGLRNYLADDGSSDIDDSLVMHTGRKMNDGRF